MKFASSIASSARASITGVLNQESSSICFLIRYSTISPVVSVQEKQTAWALFIKDKYAATASLVDSQDSRDVIKVLGQEWRSLSAADKAKYQMMLPKKTTRHNAWTVYINSLYKQTQNHLASQGQPAAFMHVMKALSSAWKDMPAEEKQKYALEALARKA